ncbi:methionyl-tRNA formyltransferase [Rhodoferax sp.]|uniref:methionyl-tRNA formyltransferase n=1 Tax=Rhodoferax sp. TaxID=50421 RepID=UPI002733CD14|nr:methionyl-tRNA formyltransferase [Rhodoferax sp.]MDP3192919.1 methionyl-tRNA formyltransferase [Rhodoferax sp.]MDP3337553.1 methionyl-tRNA formyltransferase [Rhodoferax sp.]
MKLVFAGTPEFAAVALAHLQAAGHDIALVLSQPDRPAGRGLKVHTSPVKQFALAHGMAVAQPRSLRLDGKYPDDAEAARAALVAAQADAMVVAAYGLILPQWVLDLPRLGCFNIHASLLPRWRGAAPIHRAIEAGDAVTGITIMQMDAGLDTGDMLLTQTLPISPTDTTGRLHDRLAELGGVLMVQALNLAGQGKLQPIPQALEGVSYASKIDKAEASIDWSQTAQTISQRVRAFDPFPGASTVLAGETLKIWAAEPGPIASQWPSTPGQIVACEPSGIVVAAGDSTLIVTELQRPGGKRLTCAEFLRGCPLQAGQVLG